MAYSDYRILPAIRRLCAEKKPVTLDEISRESGVPYSTLKRRIAHLERAGVIQRERLGKRWGNHFAIAEAATA